MLRNVSGGNWGIILDRSGRRGVEEGDMGAVGGGDREGASHNHGCTLLDFLTEVRGNDRGNSVDFCGCCLGLPRKSAGFHGS